MNPDRQPRLRSLLMIAGMLMMISVQFWFPLTGLGDWAPVENRGLHQLPDFDRGQPEAFAAGYQSYFQDNFAVRYRLIGLERRVRYQVLGEQVFGNVMIGEEGWLFLANTQALNTCQRIDLISEEKLAGVVENLAAGAEHLAAQGVEMAVTVLPEKCTVYPEFSPIPAIGTESYHDQFFRAAEGFPQLETIRVLEALEAGKAEGQVYYKSDTHWNHAGMTLAYRELISGLQPDVELLPESALKVESYRSDGDLGGQLGMPGLFSEEVESYTFENEIQIEKLENKAQAYTNRRAGNDLTLVVFHDSFLFQQFPKLLLARHFGRVVFLDLNQGYAFSSQPDFLDAVVASWSPDVVLVERTERSLNTLKD